MSDRHFVDDEIILYVEAPGAFAQREALEAHVQTCEDCGERLADTKELIECFRDPEFWKLHHQRTRKEAVEPPAEMPQRLLDVARAIADEDAQAERFAPSLLSEQPESWKSILESSPRLVTAGVVRTILDRARLVLQREPARSLQFCDLALDIWRRFPKGVYGTSFTLSTGGDAWKERANALRFLGRYREALEALEHADGLYCETTVDEPDLAATAYIRATVYCALERFTDALELTRRSAKVFGNFGMPDRELHAGVLEGAILYQMSQPARALHVFLDLVEPAEKLGETATLARLFHNIGNCHSDLGDLDAAGSCYLRAVMLFEGLGMETEKARLRFGLGRMLVAGSQFRDGIAMLRQARAEFEKLEMPAESGVVALQMAEAMLAANQPDEVAEICRALVEEFTSAGMPSNAITALSFLREAVAQQRATPAVVAHVRLFLERLPNEPEALFAPPPRLS